MSKSMDLIASTVMLMKTYLVADYKYLDDIISQESEWGKRYPDLGTYIFRNADFNQIVNDAFLRCEQFSENGCLWIFVTDNKSNPLEPTAEQRHLAESHQWKIINLHVGNNADRENEHEILIVSNLCRLKEIFSAIELLRTTDSNSVNDHEVASFLSHGENIQFVQYNSNDNGAIFTRDKIKLSTPYKVK